MTSVNRPAISTDVIYVTVLFFLPCDAIMTSLTQGLEFAVIEQCEITHMGNKVMHHIGFNC